MEAAGVLPPQERREPFGHRGTVIIHIPRCLKELGLSNGAGIGIQKRLGVALQLGDYRRPLPSLDVLLTRALTCVLIIAVSKVRLEEAPETCRRVELSLQEVVALSTTLLQSLCSSREDG